MEDDWNMDCVVTEATAQMNLKAWAAEVWPEGTEVERDIDGCWFPAKILSFSRDATFGIQFTDDNNVEEGVEVEELRAKKPDGSFEYLSEEVAKAAAAKLPSAPSPDEGASVDSAGGSRTGSRGWEKVDDEMELGAWEASETGSDGGSSRPQTNTSASSGGSDWLLIGSGEGTPGPPEEAAPTNRRPRRGGRPSKAVLDENAAQVDVASGSGLRALRALRRSKSDAAEAASGA